MSIMVLITTTTKIAKWRLLLCNSRNEIYCWYLMYSDYSSQQRNKFVYGKMFFPNLYNNSHFPFFEKIFYYYECKLPNIYKNTCAFIFLWWNQKQPSVFYKKAVIKNFAIFTGKHLCWSLFLIKLQAFRPDSKRDSNICIFLWILWNFEEHLQVVASNDTFIITS